MSEVSKSEQWSIIVAQVGGTIFTTGFSVLKPKRVKGECCRNSISNWARESKRRPSL